MNAFDPNFTNQAVALMKQGAPPDAVWHHLVQLGAETNQARALVEQLLELKRQAEACDPHRLRDEAAAMIRDGHPPEAALHHLTSHGIAEMHARPEIDRLVAAHYQRLASMRPCGRCGTPTPAAETFFDPLGNQVCDACHSRDEIAAGDRRVDDARLAAAGVPLHQLQESNRLKWCPRCQDHTALCASATYEIEDGSSTASRTFQCTRCGQYV
jgi:hypothetical protein